MIGPFDEHTRKTFNIQDVEIKLLNEWIGGNFTYELIYRGSRNGFKA